MAIFDCLPRQNLITHIDAMIAMITQIKETAMATAILTLLSPLVETDESVGGSPMFTLMFVLTTTLEDPPLTIVY